MIKLDIPGFGKRELEHLVLDYNGTLACDGEPVRGVRECLEKLDERLDIHVLTADTFGTVKTKLAGYPCKVSVLPPGDQDRGKRDYVRSLGAGLTVSMGNGVNDAMMLEESALGVAVILAEGVSPKALFSADIVCRDIVSALDLLLNPLRITATLRK